MAGLFLALGTDMKNTLLPAIFFLSLSPSFSLAAPLMCEDVFHAFSSPSPVSPEANQFLNSMTSIPAITGPLINPKEQAITWYSFNSLEPVKSAAEIYSAKLKTMPPAERSAELRHFLRRIDEDPTTRDLYDAVSDPKAIDYLPSQYSLRKKFYSELSKSLKSLPKDFRFPIGRVPRDQRIAKLNKEARKLTRDLEASFEKIISSTGYENFAAYEKALRSSDDPMVKKAIEIIENHQLEVVMRRPEAGRFWIPITGFQNQYVSGSSKGFMGKDGRYGVESILTDRDKPEYAKIDDEVKPKYGSLRLTEDSGVRSDTSGSTWYGTDLYSFKEEVIQDRLSIFFGDSLNHINRINPLWQNGRTAPASVWDTMLIPWNRRLLMVPYMIEGLKNNFFAAPSVTAAAEMPMSNRRDRQHNYWESQIFGRVTLDMVKTFEFENQPPSGEFLAELKKHKIKIIDRRSSPAKEWDGN